MHDIIASYRAAGWSMVRVAPCGKAPIIRDWTSRNEEPEAFQPGENVGVALGDPSGGLVDVDVDCPEAIALAPYFMPPTLTFGRVGAGKTPGIACDYDTTNVTRRHYLYRCFGAKTNRPPRAHVELRSSGLQTVIPPSIHETGVQLAWVDMQPVADLDEQRLLGCFGRLVAATAIARAFPDASGNRHDLVLSLAGALWHAGWTLEDALGLLLPALALTPSDNDGHREQAIVDTWSDDERNRYGWPSVARIVGDLDCKAIERGVELVPTMPRSIASQVESEREGEQGDPRHTDLGNAEEFVRDHGRDLRFAAGLSWIQWDGARWAELPIRSEPYHLAGQTARRLQRQGVDTSDSTLAKWGQQSENLSRLNAMLRIARDLPSMRVDPDTLDSQPMLLCCPNGVVDLSTGQLHPHGRELLQTKVTGVPYDPTATAPRFEQFMLEVMCGDVELAAYVLRYLGYSLTAITSEQVLQIWYGGGANGKSTLIDTIRAVIGDYGQILASDLLIERRFGRDSSAPSPDVARLRGARFAAGVETKEGQRLNESLVKQLTGGDRVVARHLHREPIEFDPTWKLALAVNHKPIVRGTDRGMWRRIHLVPFDASFEGDRADRSLAYRLQIEGPGILATLVRACQEWQRVGLAPPARVLAEVEKYRAGQDIVGAFLDECCEINGTQNVPIAQLYRAYSMWCQDSGEYQLGKHTFNNRLRERGLVEAYSGGKVWKGLSLRSTVTV